MCVLVKCCLHERVFNKYYCVLASRLCNHDNNHKFTLHYCIWDHHAELESMKEERSRRLAKFTAEMVSGFTLSHALLKKADLHVSQPPLPITGERAAVSQFRWYHIYLSNLAAEFSSGP
ncbi:putative initiation factor eIF-4 gamma, MA3 [Helianthus debilis subsp. tardiflorus]